MSDALSIAANALDSTASRIAKTASSIVNASSIGATNDLTKQLAGLTQDKTAYAAQAEAVRAAAQDSKTLLDIFA